VLNEARALKQVSKTSFSYRLTEWGVFISMKEHKRILSLKAPELAAYLEQHKNTLKTEPPRFIAKRHKLDRETIQGKPCFIVSQKNAGLMPEQAEKAVLFLHGGAYIFETHAVHWNVISTLVEKLGIPVWAPAYPLFPDNTTEQILSMVDAVYAEMQKRYSRAKIIVIGDSAGADLALSLCHRNKARRLKQPDKIILVSPASAVERDEGILTAMRRIEPKDPMLSMGIMESMSTLFDLSDPYFATPLSGDFSGFPEMLIFSGTHDMFYPQVPPFVSRVRDAGIAVEFVNGNEMMHVWPYMPIAEESKQAFHAICDSIKNTGIPS
jgi:acetyl esterase/lipase